MNLFGIMTQTFSSFFSQISAFGFAENHILQACKECSSPLSSKSIRVIDRQKQYCIAQEKDKSYPFSAYVVEALKIFSYSRLFLPLCAYLASNYFLGSRKTLSLRHFKQLNAIESLGSKDLAKEIFQNKAIEDLPYLVSQAATAMLLMEKPPSVFEIASFERLEAKTQDPAGESTAKRSSIFCHFNDILKKLEGKLMQFVLDFDIDAESLDSPSKDKKIQELLERYSLGDAASPQQRELARAEYFAKLVYQDLKIGEKLQYPNLNGGLSECSVAFVVNEGGFCCYLLQDGKDLYLCFRGSKGLSSIVRDLEPDAAGSESFYRHMPNVLKHLREFIDAREDLNLFLSGHSLGGADAGKAAILIQNLYNEGDLQNFSALNLYHFNAPAVSHKDEALLDKECFSLLSKNFQIQAPSVGMAPLLPLKDVEAKHAVSKLESKDQQRPHPKKSKLALAVHHVKMAGDPIQTFGQVFPFSKHLEQVDSYTVYYFDRKFNFGLFRIAEFIKNPRAVSWAQVHTQGLFSNKHLSKDMQEDRMKVLRYQNGQSPSLEFKRQVNYIIEPYLFGFEYFKKYARKAIQGECA